MARDEACARIGIPSHLHSCGRQVVSVFSESELLYRRIKLPCADAALQVSFARKSSSTNRSNFSGPEDVLWDDKGHHHFECGIIAFPVASLKNMSWESNEQPPVNFKIEVSHAPLRCNYAHTDFRFFRNGVEVADITTKSIKLRIREALRPLIRSVHLPKPAP